MVAVPRQQVIELPREPDRDLLDQPAQQLAAEELMLERVGRVARTWRPTFIRRLQRVLSEAARPAFRREAREVLEFLNAKKGGRGYDTDNDVHLNLIAERLAEGATVQECKGVIAMKYRETQQRRANGEPEFAWKYLRPATLFNRTKFAQYLGELGEG